MSEFKPKFILNTGRKYTGEKLRDFLKIKGKMIKDFKVIQRSKRGNERRESCERIDK